MAYFSKKKGIIWAENYPGAHLSNSKLCAEGFHNTLNGVSKFKKGDYTATSQIALDIDIQQYKEFVDSNSVVVFTKQGRDHLYAETADIVYFCGHGDANKIIFSQSSAPLGDNKAHYFDISLGDGDVKWLVLDACEVLFHDPINNSIFSRWTKIFSAGGGLRYVFGFHSLCKNDNNRGTKFALNLNPQSGGPGMTFVAAWCLACEETDKFASWAFLRVGDNMNPVKEDSWTSELLPPVPDTSNGNPQLFTYVQRSVAQVTNIINVN